MRGDGGVEQRIVLVGVAVSRDGDNDAYTAPRRHRGRGALAVPDVAFGDSTMHSTVGLRQPE